MNGKGDSFHHSTLSAEDLELASISHMSQMIPYVYVTSWDVATDMQVMRDKNIKYILNISDAKKDQLTLNSMARLGITHEQLSVENTPTYTPGTNTSLVDALPIAYTSIRRAVDLKKNIVVHCAQGVSTSPAAIAYYLLRIFYQKVHTPDNKLPMILQTFKNKRSCIDINFGFLEILEDMEAQFSGRAVCATTSMSVRRNTQLKHNINERLRRAVADERTSADRSWGVGRNRLN